MLTILVVVLIVLFAGGGYGYGRGWRPAAYGGTSLVGAIVLLVVLLMLFGEPS